MVLHEAPARTNVAGPCQADIHYMLPAMRRLPMVRSIIDQQGYSVVNEPRRVGKTMARQTLAQELPREGYYVSALLSVEVGSAFPHDLYRASGRLDGVG